jgi:ribosomal protein S18 acetylase RimI-like enzyme
MATIPRTPSIVDIASPVFTAITQWPFEEDFVARILADDIPQRVKYQNCGFWADLNPEKAIVAFGSLSVCHEYAELTDGLPHTYIPLLAVHPDQRGLGHGRSVFDHLVSEAACIVRAKPGSVQHAVFLDVYKKSTVALGLYQKCGFQTLGSGPFVDPLINEPYRVLAKRAPG